VNATVERFGRDTNITNEAWDGALRKVVHEKWQFKLIRQILR